MFYNFIQVHSQRPILVSLLQVTDVQPHVMDEGTTVIYLTSGKSVEIAKKFDDVCDVIRGACK